MPEAVSVAVAKAVVTHIEAGVTAEDFSQEFTLERSYADWDLELTEADLVESRESEKLRVDVVAHTTEQVAELSARGKVQVIVPVDIAVRQKLGPDKQNDDTGRVKIEVIDALMLFLQEMWLRFTKERLTQDEFGYSVWDNAKGGTKLLAAPIKEHLRQKQFTGIVRVYFRTDASL